MPAAHGGFPPPAGQPLLAGEEKRGASERGEGTGTLHPHRPGSPRTRVFRLLVLNPGRDLGSWSPLSPSLRLGTKKSSLATPGEAARGVSRCWGAWDPKGENIPTAREGGQKGGRLCPSPGGSDTYSGLCLFSGTGSRLCSRGGICRGGSGSQAGIGLWGSPLAF